MIDSTTTFLKRLKGVSLSANERLMLRQKLAAYSDMHPLVPGGVVRSPLNSFFLFTESRRFSTYAMALLLVIVAGGGVSLAADASVPGESLYSIKINVNEPVLTALTPTATGQAKVAAQLATRRIDEAVTLASRGALTPERQAYLTQEFGAHAKVAAAKADTLASTGDNVASDNVKANFAATLAGEAQALGAITTKDSAQSASLLRAVVAVTETISPSGPAGDFGIAAATPEIDNGTTTPSVASGTRPVLMMAKVRSVASSTAAAASTMQTRVPKNLRVESTTLQGRLAPSMTGAVILPKSDVAIPSVHVQPTSFDSSVQKDTNTEAIP